MSSSNQTRFADSVETIKPLVYRIVWHNGKEELLTGTQMLEKGLGYLNANCEIYEYERVSPEERQERQCMEAIYSAAYDLAMRSSSEDTNPYLVRLKNALDSYSETRFKNHGGEL
jgi:hypothetical protein